MKSSFDNFIKRKLHLFSLVLIGFLNFSIAKSILSTGTNTKNLVDKVVGEELKALQNSNMTGQKITISPNMQEEIDKLAQKEIEKELRALHKREKATLKLAKRIDGKVKREVRRQNRELRRRAIKDKLAGRVRLHNPTSDEDFIYKIPSWPFYSIFYAEKDLVELSLNAEWATKAYDSSGSSCDISKLVFGKNPLEVQDILLVSKLLRQGLLRELAANDGHGNPGLQYHYFYVLADHPLKFNFSMNQQTLAIKYARHFKDGDISFGMDVPIVQRTNKIRFESTMTTSAREVLETYRPAFFSRYGGLEDFFDKILQAKNIGYNKKDTETSLGDITTFLNVEIISKYFERLLVGTRALFPTANDTITDRLWHPQLGNGGFVEVGFFASMLWDVNDLINPHLFVDVSGSFPANVMRRVPQKKEYGGERPNSPVSDFLKFSTAATMYTAQPFSEFDTTVRNFANDARLVKMRKGMELAIHLGNIFEHLFSRKSYLDLFYDLRVKAKDYVGHNSLGDGFLPAVLTRNSFEVAQKIGFNYLYHFDGRKRLSSGLLYTFAGRNVTQSLELNLAFNLEF